MLIHFAVSRVVLVTYWELVDADVSCLICAGRTALPRLSKLQPVVAPQRAGKVWLCTSLANLWVWTGSATKLSLPEKAALVTAARE